MIKISIIIPVYNAEAFIEKCLNSVQEQTFSDFEVIIINDGSTDKTVAKVDTYMKKDTRFKLFTHTKPLGVASARNLGVKEASGEYIYFLDSDDFIHPNTLEQLVSNSSNALVVSGRMINAKKENNITVESSEPIYYRAKRRKLFKNRSILNRLIHRDLITQLPFNPNFRYFSDLELIVYILNNTEEITYVKSAIYFKKRRAIDEGISIMQEPLEGKIKQLSLLVHSLIANNLSDYSRKYLVNIVLVYYRKSIVRFIKQNEHQIENIFDDLYTLIEPISKKDLKNKSIVLKREIKRIQTNSLKDYKRLMLVHNRLRNIKNSFKKTKILSSYRRFVYKVGSYLPQNKQLIIFESFHGKQFSDNPRALYEYIKMNYPDYNCYWSVDASSTEIFNTYNLNTVNRFSFKWLLLLPRAKYWIFNTRIPLWINKPERVTYLQTWHGTPLKKLGIDIMNVTMPGTNTEKYKENFQKASSRWDYLISPNHYSTQIFTRAFGFEGKVIETGYPRNDILTTENNIDTINRIKEHIGIDKEKKVILYAPTWRDNQFHKKGAYKFKLELDLQRFKETYGDQAVLLLRMHYLIADAIDLSGYENIIYDMSRYSDIRELYLISDGLITDYSSVFFDYGKLKRPILFYVYDLEVYRDQLRGFYLDFYNEAPGPLLETNDSLFDQLHHIINDTYRLPDNFIDFHETYCYLEDGQATKRVISKLFEV